MAGPDDPATDHRLIVDAMNVIGSRPDGWWHDRPGAVRDLVTQLEVLAASRPRVAITAVVDGRPPPDPPGAGGPVRVLYAGRDRDAADDRIVELLGRSEHPATVVTADRELRRRASSRGASLIGPRSLLDDLDEVDPGGSS